MEFFDKLTKKASETYKGAAEMTGKIAKEAKLKIKINDNKSKINDLYQEIGKKVYQKHTANEDLCIKKELEDECAKIDILSSEIETYHKEILSLSDIKPCIKCKEPIAKNAKFCPNCGEEQPEEEEIPVEVIDNNEENATTSTEETHEEENNQEINTQCSGCEGQNCVNNQENPEMQQNNDTSSNDETEINLSKEDNSNNEQ